MPEATSPHENSNSKTPIVIFHRANTLAACRHALNYKAEMIEFDVRRTKDGEMVVYHDPEIEGESLKNLTYLELKEMAISYQNLEVPTLEDLLKYTKGKTKLDVELKEGGYEKEAMDMVLQYFSAKEIVATSFVHKSIGVIKEAFPEIKGGLLLGKSYFVKYTDVFPGRRFSKTKADFIAPNYQLLRLGVLNRAYKHNVPVYVWTVNKKRVLRKFMQDPRIAGVITDNLSLAYNTQKKQTRIIKRKKMQQPEAS